MRLERVTYEGPPVDDLPILEEIPSALADLLRRTNGFIQFDGGLHVRGACLAPDWHSLREAWHGEAAFQRLYKSVNPMDVPFGEDCLGDQFFLREGVVWKLMAETDDARSLEVSLEDFLLNAQRDPVQYLEMQPLLRYLKTRDARLEPGQLLAAYPPFSTLESKRGVSLRPIPTTDRRRFLAEWAAIVRGATDGMKRAVN